MSDAKVKTYADFMLPPSVVTKVDVSHLVSELERVDDNMTAVALRHKKEAGHEPVMSQQLADFLKENKLSIDGARERSALIKQLRLLKNKVPILHMTFSVEADLQSLQKLAKWLRDEVHPQAVISVGLQPALVAGVYLRTPNHIHDFSLRALLKGQHGSLVKELETLRG
jgi:hypothetical protein